MAPQQSLLKRQLKRSFGEGFEIPREWQSFIAAVDSGYAEFEVDRDLLERSLEVSSQELLEANSEIRAILQAIPDLVFRLDQQGTILSVKAGAGGEMPQQEMPGKRIQECWLKHAGDRFSEVLRRVIDEQSMISIEHTQGAKGLESFHEVRLVPLLRDQVVAISRNITERKSAEAKLEQMHKQLADASRQAGMAEIATNVLHNVGNVLNSVNVSANLVMDNVKKSKVSGLAKAVALMREHESDLGAFISEDPKGKQVPGYLAQLAEHLRADQQAMVKELESLRSNIDHIKQIVSMQQSYATVSGVTETVNVIDLLEDSLRMNEGSYSHHGIEIIREYGEVPPIKLDKHRVLQVLVNLLRNAKHACDDSGRSDKRLTVRVESSDGRIRISVTDNGVGIEPENMKKIFNHGFTTRKSGHGFGFHSGALAAKEMAVVECCRVARQRSRNRAVGWHRGEACDCPAQSVGAAVVDAGVDLRLLLQRCGQCDGGGFTLVDLLGSAFPHRRIVPRRDPLTPLRRRGIVGDAEYDRLRARIDRHDVGAKRLAHFCKRHGRREQHAERNGGYQLLHRMSPSRD